MLGHAVVEKVAVHKADVMLGVVELLVEVYQVNHEKTVLKKKKGKKKKKTEVKKKKDKKKNKRKWRLFGGANCVCVVLCFLWGGIFVSGL